MLLLCCVALTTFVAGQSFAFKNFTTNDGLVQTEITDIKQDKKGNIWIGTNGGISVYNGKKISSFDEHDLLQSLRINALLCDTTGSMWIGTQNGLLRYSNGFQTVFKNASSQNSSITSLALTSANEILFVCDKVLYTIKKNGQAVKLPVSKNIDGRIAMAATDKQDNLWIVTTSLQIFKKTDKALIAIYAPFSTEAVKQGLAILRILGKEGPVPYIVTNFGSFWVRNDSLQLFYQQYPQFFKAGVGNATYVMEDGDSTIWVGGTAGLAKILGRKTQRYNNDNGFIDNSVSCLFIDREHNLWIGCTYNGVYKLSNEALFHLKPKASPTDLRHVTNVVSLSPRTNLIGTWGKGLFWYESDSLSRVNFPNPLIRYITTLLTVGNATYIGWFGKGLWKLDHSSRRFTEVTNFSTGEAVQKLSLVGGKILVRTLNNTCYLTDDQFNIKARAALPSPYALTVVNDKIYQLNPSGGVNVLNEQLQESRKNIFPEISSRVTQLVAYKDLLLAGTFGQGLFIYNQNGKLVKRLDKKSGLNTNIVTSLLVDGNQLFIGANTGLIQAELPQLQRIKLFNENEGMFNWECRQEGLKKLADGAIFISTTNGPYIYYPDRDITAQYTAGDISMLSFEYGKHLEKSFPVDSLLPQAVIEQPINFKDNVIRFTLNGVSQRHPDEILYHYQLQGYDPMWVTTHNPVIDVSDMQPGKYKLVAFLSIGDYQSPRISVAFSIARPLSGQLWFQVLLILFLSVLCWALLSIGNRIYQRYIQAKMMSKMEADVAMKQQLTANSINFSQRQYKELQAALQLNDGENRLAYFTQLFLKDIGNRIDLLWRQESMTLQELHDYFDELLSGTSFQAKVYHKTSAGDVKVEMPVMFNLLQIFSLYLFIGLYNKNAEVFSLDSEVKSDGQILLRFYTVKQGNADSRTSTYQLLQEAIQKQQHQNLVIDVVENLELGNMLVAEINHLNRN